MITVAILINGQPLITRSAVNRGQENENNETLYETDCGKEVRHKRDDGAIILAKKLLDLVNYMR